MEEKKSLSKKLGEFFAGKGFYIVLLLSAAVIGTSIWLINAERGTVVEETEAPAVQIDREDLIPKRVENIPELSEGEREESYTIYPEKPDTDKSLPVMQMEDAASETAEALEFIWPVGGEMERAYSMDALSYDRTMSDWRTHSGCDLSAEPGETVMAAADGTVSAVYEDELLGKVVEIDHGSGIVSVYANLEGESAVSVGQRVSAGDTVGTVGATALGEIGEESHLHFAVRLNGENADPTIWLPERG